MSTSYDPDGVEDLICGAPPDFGGGEPPDGDGGDEPGPGGIVTDCGVTLPVWTDVTGIWLRLNEGMVFQPVWRGLFPSYRPNCFFGGWDSWFRNPDGNYIRFAPAGGPNVDMTIEAWVKLRLDPSYNFGAGPPSLATYFPGFQNYAAFSLQGGTFTSSVLPVFGFISYGGQIRARYTGSPPATALEVNMNVPPGWHHWCVTLTRGGNLAAWVDGTLQGTQAGVLNYTIASIGIRHLTGILGNGDALGWFGPMALHERVLTPAEIGASYRRKTVQVNAQTGWAIDPREGPQLPRDVIEADAWSWMWVDNRVGAGAAPISSSAYVWENIDYGDGGVAKNVGVGGLNELYAMVQTGCTPTSLPFYTDLSGNGRHLRFGGMTFGIPYTFATDRFWM